PPNVVFTGYCFGDGYRELGSNAYAFVESSGVGGTHPALLEAMAMGNCVVVNGTEENLETIGEAGLSYREQDDEKSAVALAGILQRLLDDPQLTEAYRQKARLRAQTEYTWESVTDRYERLFMRVLGVRDRGSGSSSTRTPKSQHPIPNTQHPYERLP